MLPDDGCPGYDGGGKPPYYNMNNNSINYVLNYAVNYAVNYIIHYYCSNGFQVC